MIKVKINRLWNGFASIRNYLVEKAFNEKKDLQIILKEGNKIMTIPWDKLLEGIENPTIYDSQYSKRKYYLIDYKWKSDSINQKRLFL